nr:beta-N-acetylhexosaminidase [uncultured Sellimonas sp.]
MKLIVKDSKFQEASEILLKHFAGMPEEELEIYPEYTEKSGLKVLKYGTNVKIQYHQEVQYYRALGMVFGHVSEDFSSAETACTSRLGAMFDCSRNGVLRVETVKRYIEYLALLGMNDLLLYTEDTYEIPKYPHFGAMRGRYSKEDIREIERYAAKFGIELVPCIQTLAHLRTFLRWPVTEPMRDNSDILLVGEEKVYDFLEAMIRSVRASFSGKRIHIGMDEAFQLGLGNYLRKNGYQDRTGIMKKHLDRVCEICRKYDFDPMIWSDMYFMLAAEDGRYYNVPEDYEWKEEDRPDPEINLVYWDYYNASPDVYRKMVHLHKKLSGHMYFAGGGWTWNGIAPNYARALETTRVGTKVMKEEGADKWFCTLWQDDGAETPMETCLLPLTYFAECAYEKEVTMERLHDRMKELFGIESEDLMLLDQFDNFQPEDPHNLKSANPSKLALYQDPLLGIFDGQFAGKGLREHYWELADKLEVCLKKEMPKRTGNLLAYYQKLAAFLAEKAEMGLEIKSDYDNEDQERLRQWADKRIPECLEMLEELRERREALWMEEYRPQGYEVLDIRLGGVRNRLESARNRISRWLAHPEEPFEELEERRVCFWPDEGRIYSFNRWEQIVSASNINEL